MVEFNGALYSYVHNLQGDVVGIVDSAGSLVVEYKYDAWGKPTLVRTLTTAYEALAELNPFRYRGYVWDEEVEMYRLEKRCYVPSICHFLNSDEAISCDYAVLYTNVYTYCINSPVVYTDIMGLWPQWLETAAKVVSGAVAVGAAIAVAVCTAPITVAVATIGFGAAVGGIVGGIANEQNGESYINGWIGGAANGAIQTACSYWGGTAGFIFGGAVGGGVGSVIIDSLNNIGKEVKKTWNDIMRDGWVSALSSLLTSGLTSVLKAGIGMAQTAGGYNSWLPSEQELASITKGFGKVLETFFGVIDDWFSYQLSGIV